MRKFGAMTMSSILFGAGLACALGGAVIGTGLGSTPIGDRTAVGLYYQTHPSSAGGSPPTEALRPDHFPLVTPWGTVPVERLAERGLYSQARYRMLAADPADRDARFADSGADSHGPGPGSGWIEEPRSPANGGPQTAQFAMLDTADAGSRAPLELAQGPATVPNSGNARMIDVAAALAAR